MTLVEHEENQEDVDGDSAGEDQEERDEDSEEEDEEIEKPRKRAKKTPQAQSRRKSSGAKTNGVAKGAKGRKPKKRQSGPVEAPENPNECPMLGNIDSVILLIVKMRCWMRRLLWIPLYSSGSKDMKTMKMWQ